MHKSQIRSLIIEGKETLIENEEDEGESDAYIFINSEGSRSHMLEFTVELENDPSKKILILANAGYECLAKNIVIP